MGGLKFSARRHSLLFHSFHSFGVALRRRLTHNPLLPLRERTAAALPSKWSEGEEYRGKAEEARGCKRKGSEAEPTNNKGSPPTVVHLPTPSLFAYSTFFRAVFFLVRGGFSILLCVCAQRTSRCLVRERQEKRLATVPPSSISLCLFSLCPVCLFFFSLFSFFSKSRCISVSQSPPPCSFSILLCIHARDWAWIWLPIVSSFF